MMFSEKNFKTISEKLEPEKVSQNKLNEKKCRKKIF